ncbi:uncharacterized protein G2W53_018059 [Senna tora]|uniref:Uncharacterized protein n=1 Tax=Senna tora TaxID=362788 RepID=A0A834WKQ8_9FABA|nr:uncharacterized protein G2W53_018059 [Senna tora]
MEGLELRREKEAEKNKGFNLLGFLEGA